MILSPGKIKKIQHKYYRDFLDKIEKGEIESKPFSPYSDFGKLCHSKINKKFSL